LVLRFYPAAIARIRTATVYFIYVSSQCGIVV